MNTITLLLLVQFLAMAAATTLQEEWENWKKTYNKVYDSPREEARRLGIWKKNKALVEDHNRHASEHGFTLGMNKFADRDEQEMKMRTGLLHEKPSQEEIHKHMVQARDFKGSYPPSIDRRDKDAVLAVKDEGQFSRTSE